MKKRITNRLAETIKAENGERLEIIDEITTGLRFRINKNGSKSWSLLTKNPAGKKVRITLGTYPELTVADARSKAVEQKQKILNGYDPAAAKRASKENAEKRDVSITLEEGLDLYATAVLSSQRTGYQTQRDLRRDFAKLLTFKATDISPAMIVQIVDDKSRTAPTMARRLIAYARPWFRWLLSRGHLSSNPCDGIDAPGKEMSRDRVLTSDELVAIWNATALLGYPFGPFVRILLLTGQRREEVAGMLREEIDFESITWTVPASRSKTNNALTVPLTPTAILTLNAALSKSKATGLVFTTNNRSPISGFSKMKHKLDSLSGVDNWRLHDFRRTMVSTMAEIGIDPVIADRCLNHSASATLSTVARVYQRSDLLEQRREATNAWCDKLIGWVEQAGHSSAPSPFLGTDGDRAMLQGELGKKQAQEAPQTQFGDQSPRSKRASEAIATQALVHNNRLEKYKERWEKSDHNPTYILHALKYSEKTGVSPPKWATDPLVKAGLRFRDSNGDVSVDDALRLKPKVFKHESTAVRKLNYVKILAEATDSEMTFDEAIELTLFETEYILGYSPLERSTLLNYYQNAETNRDGFAFIFVWNLGRCADDKDIQEAMVIQVKITQAIESIEIRRPVLKFRLEAYRECVAQNIDKAEIPMFVAKKTVAALRRA